jgi:ABC-type nitrate/sulfonate/bicarbonate transport system ATPase subunit
MIKSYEDDLILKDVCFSYNSQVNNKVICNNLSLSIKSNNFTSIIGPSGSGKTSLLKLIAGLLRPISGKIKFKNTALSDIIEDITMVQQNVALMPWLTVFENIAFGLQNNKNNSKELILRTINKVGLKDCENLYPHELSGGMSQRVAIARALIFKPKLFLLDEPFGALDNLSREIIAHELVAIIKKELSTVVMVTHSIEEAALLSDEVLIVGSSPLYLIKRCIPPKTPCLRTWQDLGLRKSLDIKTFQNYLKLIREKSYEIVEEG